MFARLRRPLIILGVIVGSYLLHYLPVSRQLLRALQLRVYDTLLDYRNAFSDSDRAPVFDDICIVDIDEQSISALGQFSSWPSLYFADLVDSLANDNPILIAFDVFFTESDSINAFGQQRMSEHLAAKGYQPQGLFQHYTSDADFARAIREAGNVYLAMFNSSVSPPEGSSLPDNLIAWEVLPKKSLKLQHPKVPIPLLGNSAYRVGFAHIEPDLSGEIHDYPLFLHHEDEYYVNFSFQACLDLLAVDEIVQGKDLLLKSQGEQVMRLPLTDDGLLFLNYYGRAGRFRYISFSDVLLGNLADGYFEDRIVLVGTSASGLRDIKTTPLDADYPGVELHATLMQNILTEDFIQWLPRWLSWLICIVLLSGLSFVMRYLKPLLSIVVFLGASVLLLLAFYLSFVWGPLCMDYSVFLLPWIIGYLVLLINESQMLLAEKKKVRNAFEHYVSKAVISQIMKVNDPLKVGGEKKTASILFVDIRGFSSICEQVSPEQISSFLHEFFNRSTRIITKNRGTLDKYMGDAILALYNVPMPISGFQTDVCNTALGIVKESLLIRDSYANHPVLCDFKIGVGIATGEIIAGNFGSDEIFNYTGIGDRMNLASRLESLNKAYRTSIIIESVTYDAVSDIFLCRWLDRVCVKGKGEVVDIYELLCPISEATESQNKLCQLYGEGLKAMTEAQPELARARFEQVLKLFPQDYPCQLMLKRLSEIKWDCWDGYYSHESK
ncbi:MAG: adenylate/guanylate cyclase domain-containing protein [Candidatus Cloacimonetes bacterium]|jgi:adenylate cyclase|nr:adenylate/guanylate cyclase domain-containing protein [Candidatus Cloacimonadota bacterium]MCB5287424.1 adenylate/guanylate cyclase domain-containing protein [Candidatus Cloacimonadota bacterium]MCK9184210.1 adenylate/guanylate cyclase domain-containing protein [Candidatus Cloacimonadota bacterium]MCK9583656.1 adenylate/guanylate cyclase domain-containing protein [Candidatus Cloacimonadota bacterium]MDY0229745.1 adenylate/guanylate cyclase domain-containing protein [Candidatus Cloacimonadace